MAETMKYSMKYCDGRFCPWNDDCALFLGNGSPEYNKRHQVMDAPFNHETKDCEDYIPVEPDVA
jgi:hypothetical protein